jgi:molybdopterin synthase sulfur carrier subunit
MKVTVRLFGAFRDYEPGAAVMLDMADGASVADLREALASYGVTHWPGFRPGLLRVSAFASETTMLREHEKLPDDGRVVVLPPVSGG